jgi:hypothetical protein
MSNKIQEENSSITELIEAGSEIEGSVSGALIGGALLGPMGLIFGGAAGPILTILFTKAGKEVKKRVLGDREESRIGFTYAIGLYKIKLRLESGEKLRADGFFENDESDRSTAEEILEGVLRSAQNEFREKKLRFYGNLLANIAFDSTISRDKANLFLKIAQNLTYQQLCILQFLSQNRKIYLNWNGSFRQSNELLKYNSLEPAVRELENYNLLIITTRHKYPDIDSILITKSGQELVEFMELNEIDENDINSLESELSEIKDILIRNEKLRLQAQR